MRNFLTGSVFCLVGLLLTACTGGISNDKPPAPTTAVVTEAKAVEAELKGALTRSGLNTENIVFQAVSEVVTFRVGTCEGEIERTPDGTTYMLSISQRQDQAKVLSTSYKAGERGILDAEQRKTVTEKCGRP